MRNLHLLIIHSKHLEFRKKYLLSTLKIIHEVSTNKGYTYIPHFIQTNDLNDVKMNIKSLEGEVEKYSGDDNTFELTKPLNIEQISNFLKHRDALNKIIEIDGEAGSSTTTNYYMVIEDDCTIIPEFIKNFEVFLENPEVDVWDILFLCLTHPKPESYSFNDTRQTYKILPSKEMFCIKPFVAKKVLECMKKIQMPYKQQLSYFIHTHPEVKSLYSSLRLSIEGSKIGIYPSATTDNNILLYNKDFITMLSMLSNKEGIDYVKAEELFNQNKHLESADIAHLYGVILYKSNNFKEAKNMFDKAIDIMVERNGILSRRSELLNNAININLLVQTA